MATNNAPKAKSPREALLKILDSKRQIYKVALKYAFLLWKRISFSSLFEDSEAERESILTELRKMTFLALLMILREFRG